MQNKHLEGKISIGYNRQEQLFFDIINSYKNYLHSYYFNPSYNFGASYSWENELFKMKSLETYGIKGNILFNFPQQKNHEENKIILHSFLRESHLNIEAVTIRNQEQIDVFKEVSEELKFHVSVTVPIHSLEDLEYQFQLKDIDCVNLDHAHIFDLSLIKQIHGAGIKVKLISNEQCIWNRNYWSQYYFGRDTCFVFKEEASYCGRGCRKLFQGKNLWLNLTRQIFTKEFLPYYENNLDIIKISTRHNTNQEIVDYLGEFTSAESTKIFDVFYFPEGIPADFIQRRFHCKHNCLECSYCRDFFEKEDFYFISYEQ